MHMAQRRKPRYYLLLFLADNVIKVTNDSRSAGFLIENFFQQKNFLSNYLKYDSDKNCYAYQFFLFFVGKNFQL